MSSSVNALFQFRRDVSGNWGSVNPVLASGEMGLELDTGKIKFGDGSTAWSGLAYFSGSGVQNFADGEAPSGVIDGVNATFVLAHAPNPSASLMLHRNGLFQVQGLGNDYTLSAATVTMEVAPTINSVLRASYRY